MAKTIKSLLSKEKYLQNPLKCKECGNVIPYDKRKSQGKYKFCGNFCSSKYYSKVGKNISDDALKKMSEGSRLAQKRIWTEEKRKIHSEKMCQVVNKRPESYSTKNVCGRVKGIYIVDSYGNKTKCLGKWEFLVVEYLNKSGIKWTNKIDENFQYFWNGSYHRYFPDFYLVDYDVYVEVKGYERDRDRSKWKNFNKKLIVIKKPQIEKIKNNTFLLTDEDGSSIFMDIS